jgi:hypothetical protein
VQDVAAWMTASPTTAPRPRLPPTGGKRPSRPPSDGRPASPGGRVGELALELDNPLSYVNADLAFVADEVSRLAGRLEAAGPGCTGLAETARQILEAAADARDGVEKLRVLVRELQWLSASAGSGPRRR